MANNDLGYLPVTKMRNHAGIDIRNISNSTTAARLETTLSKKLGSFTNTRTRRERDSGG